MNFNEEQQKAIETDLSNPVLVLAGAGTGKTSVLTNRIVYLINNLNLDPNRILAITFTNKAGNEIKERVSKFTNEMSWIGTFHSICLRILKSDVYLLNRDSSFKIIDSEDTQKLIKEIYQTLGYTREDISYKNALSYIDKIKRHFSPIGFDETIFDTFCEAEHWNQELINNKSKISKIWETYEKKLESLNYFDFNDLLAYAHFILENFEQRRNYWSDLFQYILVDEFQDTNDIQYSFLKHLATKHKNIFVVGDIDQTIYSFRGANPEIINKYIKDFEPTTIILKQNYRSTQSILDVSNDLIAKNENRIKKSLYSYDTNNIGIKPILYEAKSDEIEASWVCNQIQELVNQGTKYGDICILVRSNYLTRTFEQELMFSDIPYRIFGGIKFYERQEIKDIIAYLNAINSNDELALKRIINVPSRKVGRTSIESLSYISEMHRMKFIDVLRNSNEFNITPLANKGIQSFIQLLDSWKKYEYTSITELVNKIIDDIHYYEYWEKEDQSRVNTVKENITELKRAIQQFEKNNPDSVNVLDDFLQTISLISDIEQKEKDDEVKIMTVHNAKGLEFDNVFLVSFNQNIFPSHLSLSEHNGIEEERRVAYVALTRAKKRLYISYSLGFDFRFAESKYKSMFLNDIDSKLLDGYQHKIIKNFDLKDDWFDSLQPKEKIKVEEQYNESTGNDYSIGDIVAHITFGQGVIVDIDNDILSIDFKKPIGNKKIIYNHKSIKRAFS